MDDERARDAGYKFGYRVAGPVLGLLFLVAVITLMISIAKAAW